MKLSRSGRGFIRVSTKEQTLLWLGLPVTLMASLVLATVTLAKPTPQQTTVSQSGVAETSKSAGLLASARPRISAAIGRDQRAYLVQAGPKGLRMENPPNRLSAEFSRSGATFVSGSSRWSMALRGYGHGQDLRLASAVAPHRDVNRVEYRRGGLTEWYENGPLGVEQGFTVSHRPAGSSGGLLTLSLVLSGEPHASVDPDRRGLTLYEPAGTAFHYSGLVARDSRDRELNAWMDFDRDRLQLHVEDATAQYPITIDPLIQSAKLTASDGVLGDGLGFAVAVSADASTIVAGAVSAALGSSVRQGAAYVFVKGQSWTTTSTFAAKLTASDGAQGNQLGTGVSISSDGGVIAVAASDIGAVYLFNRPANGWTSATLPFHETNRITGHASGGDTPDFACDISLNGDGTILAVGSQQANVGGIFTGEVEVFATSDSWISFTSAQLTPSDAGGALGSSVRISADGNTIAAGAVVATVGSNSDQGAAYIFTKSANGWVTETETAKLTAADGAPFDSLGGSNVVFGGAIGISADGSTVAVGAPNHGNTGANNNQEGAGATYVFTKDSANGWQTSSSSVRLTPSDGVPSDAFGSSVGISGDGSAIVVGAPWDVTGYFAIHNSTQVPPGSLYVFQRPANGWATSTETGKLQASDGQSLDLFANSVSITSISSRTVVQPPSVMVVTGAPSAASGAAYVFAGTLASSITALNTSSLSISNQMVGTMSSPQTVTLTNNGTAYENISAVGATGPFTSTQNCLNASPIAPGGSCTEDVYFAPGSVGTFSGQLTFTDDSGGNPGSTQQVALSGTSVKAGTATAINLVSPNPALAGQAVTVNFSVAPPNGDTLTPTGTVTVNASTGESCTGSAPSGSCSLRFANAVTRTISAAYGGDTNFTSSTSAGVSEIVVDFGLSVSPSSLTIPPGHLATLTLTATSLNGFVGTLSLACGPEPPHSSCAVSPSAVVLSNSTKTSTATVNLENKGTYTLTFIGTDGSLNHSATVILTVK